LHNAEDIANYEYCNCNAIFLRFGIW